MKIKKLLFTLRALFFRTLKPAGNYWLAQRTLDPISAKFGFDRGKPIDRFWIESFLEENKALIKGSCLEITDNAYTKMFGRDVAQSDVLDIDKGNKKATIIGDLRNLQDKIENNTYDCIILTHVLGLIDDLESAVSECRRVLKPNGTLLATSSCLSPTYDLKANYWRFTTSGARYLFEKFFSEKEIEVKSYGNTLAGQCFWVGMSQEDLTLKELSFNDPKFPCIVAIKAVKTKKEIN